MEGADQVLRALMVDAGLAPHRAVDHRQQRRGELHPEHAAHVGRGREAGHVADDAAPEGDHQPVPAQPRLHERVVDRVQRAPVLVALAVGDEHAREGTQAPQRLLDLRAVARPYGAARPEDGLPAREGSEQPHEPVPDQLRDDVHSGVKVMEPHRARKGASRQNS